MNVLSCSAVLSFAALAHAGNVLVVDASGGGAFTDIQPAVLAAQDGDFVLVKAGTYAGVTIDNKALSIVADLGHDVRVVGGIRVSNLAPTRAVVISGLRSAGLLIWVNPSVVGTASGLVLQNDSGSVRAIGCTFRGWEFSPGGTPWQLQCARSDAATVAQCSDVAFAHCSFIGGFTYNDGGDGLRFESSRVALYDCALTGGHGGDGDWWCGGGGNGNAGGAGLECIASLPSHIAFVGSCTFEGGRGGSAGHVGYFGGDGGDGVRACSVANPIRDLQCTFAGGAAGSGQAGDGIPGISKNMCTASPPPPVFAGLARDLTVTRIARDNASATLVYTGQPGDQVALLVSYETAFTPLDALRGVKLTRQRKPELVLPVGTLGSGGTLSVNWPLADLGPGVQAQNVFLQALFTDASGQTTLSSPALLSVLDQAF